MFYRGTIRLAFVHHSRLTRVLAGHRAAIGSRWRRLTPDAHALLVLAHLRNGDTYQRLADGFGISVATAYRYIQEAISLLAGLAPSLTAALWRLAWSGHEYAILDGTCIPIDRLRGRLNRLYYCGKHHRHTVNLQALIDPGGNLRWISAGLPGSTHDLTAARTHGVMLGRGTGIRPGSYTGAPPVN